MVKNPPSSRASKALPASQHRSFTAASTAPLNVPHKTISKASSTKSASPAKSSKPAKGHTEKGNDADATSPAKKAGDGPPSSKPVPKPRKDKGKKTLSPKQNKPSVGKGAKMDETKESHAATTSAPTSGQPTSQVDTSLTTDLPAPIEHEDDFNDFYEDDMNEDDMNEDDFNAPLGQRLLRYDEIEIGEVVDALIMLNPEDNPSQIIAQRVFHPCAVISKLDEHKQITGYGCSTFGNSKYRSNISPVSFCNDAGYRSRVYSYLPMNKTVYGGHDPEWALHIPTVGKKTIGYLCTGYRSYMNFRRDKEVTEVRPAFTKAGDEIKTTISKDALKYILAHGRIYYKSHDGQSTFDLPAFERRTKRLTDKMRTKLQPVEVQQETSEAVDGHNAQDGIGEAAKGLDEVELDALRKRRWEQRLSSKRQHIVFDNDGSPKQKTTGPAARASSLKRKRGVADDDDYTVPLLHKKKWRRAHQDCPHTPPCAIPSSKPSVPPKIPVSSSPIPSKASLYTSEAFTAAYLKEIAAGRQPKVRITLHRHGVLQSQGVEECDQGIYESICMGQEQSELASALGVN
ncbi:hypothetical protein BJ508DRAFT_343707 [Ascobolus immersus RN42]|uniref:Uncharacterized protein n=1 Tax=Ascobolus immersus RN42 TaxID=1160509 RepID=A0A3N4IE08_ASCIM|nr:hypothetical protein BJ508DRAFT_343707 [Ascobolus immersus RN42]